MSRTKIARAKIDDLEATALSGTAVDVITARITALEAAPGGSTAAATAAALGTVKISGTPTDAANPAVYVHEQTDTLLAGKAATVHTHVESDVTGLVADLAGKVGTSDARLADARTPLSHASTHASAGSDPLTPAAIGAALTVHTHAESDVTGLVADLAAKVGTGDARLSDARTPTAHATSHQSGGSDPIRMDTLDGVPASRYDVGSAALASEQFLLHFKQLRLSSTERLTLAGTAQAIVTDLGTTAPVILGQPKVPTVSFVIPTDYYLDCIQRLDLRKGMRGTLQGTATLILTDDFATRSRLTLVGRGN